MKKSDSIGKMVWLQFQSYFVLIYKGAYARFLKARKRLYQS